MKIKFLHNFTSNVVNIKEGEIYEVLVKKEPDRWNNYTRYLIRIDFPFDAIIGIPENFVCEIS